MPSETTSVARRGPRRPAGYAVAVVAGLFLAIAGFFGVQNVIFQVNSRTAAGEIVAVDAAKAPDGSIRVPMVFEAVIEFPDNRGQFRRFTDLYDQGRPPSVGAEVEVLYNPKKPTEARVANYFQIWQPTVAAAVWALGLGIVAEELLRGSRRRR